MWLTCSVFGVIVTRESVGRIIIDNLGILKQELKGLIFSHGVYLEIVGLVLPGLMDEIADDHTN